MPYDLPTWVNGGPPTRNATNLNKYTDAINDLDTRIPADVLSQSSANALYASKTVDTMTQLKELIPTNKELRQTLGYTNVGDGGHGAYRYDSSSTAVSNIGTVIRPNSVASDASPGRWFLLHNGEVSVAQFGAVLLGPTSNTAGINAAFATGLNVTFPPGYYGVSATIKPYHNGRIIGQGHNSSYGQVRIVATAGGTFDLVAGENAGVQTLRCIWDTKDMQGTTMENIQVWCTDAAEGDGTRVAFGASGEYSAASNPPITSTVGNTFHACQAWQGGWAVYAPSSSGSHGSLTGSHWHELESHCGNGVFIGSNHDDVSFQNCRFVGIDGIGIHKKEGSPTHFDSCIVHTDTAGAIAFKVDPGSQIIFNQIFIEQAGGLTLTPFQLNGTSTLRSAVIGQGLMINSTDGTSYFDLTTGYNTVDVRGIRDKDYNGARANTKLVKLNFTTGAVTENDVFLNYLGTDTGALVSLPDTGVAYNANNRSSIEIKGQTTHKKYIALLSTSIKPEAWIAPTLTNSWVNYGGSEETAGYYKDPAGTVHLKGLIKTGTLGQSAFTLAAGYRPKTLRYAPTIANAGASEVVASVALAVSGNVIPQNGGNTYFNLSGISFRAEA